MVVFVVFVPALLISLLHFYCSSALQQAAISSLIILRDPFHFLTLFIKSQNF